MINSHSNQKQRLLLLILVFAFVLSSCKQAKKTDNFILKRIEGKQIVVDDKLQKDSKIEDFVTPYREKLDVKMNEILTYSSETLDYSREQDETKMGDFIADLCYKRAQSLFNERTGKTIDFVLFNIGGIRAAFNQGPVRVVDAYKVMPFENSLVIAELDYEAISDLLDYLAKSNNPHPISKHLNVVFDGDRVEKALLNGQPFQKDRTYHVLTNDYLMKGGDNMTFFKKAKNIYDSSYKLRTAIIDELQALDTLSVVLDQRMIRK